ncbi:MAG: acyl carrier protein phosphodiesterase [Cytophagaceae bacterium]|nr:acyl carrier protein phosphodiesterase [Cytophagaceae bacterium]
MSLLLFSSQMKNSDKHVIGCLIGGMNYKNISKCNLEGEVFEGLKAYRIMNQYMLENPAFRESSSRFIRKFRHSELMVQILFDHFFAKKWFRYHSEGYFNHVNSIYEKLVEHHAILPYSIKKLVPDIVNKNVFSELHTIEGFHKYLNFMIGIHKMSSMVNYNLADCLANYDVLSREFETLYEDFISRKWEVNLMVAEPQELMQAS